MGRISDRFAQLRQQERCALIPFITGGDPSLEATQHLLPVLAQAGADVIEIGVPFSDPLADGPTLQKASARALQGGTTLDKLFAIIAAARSAVDVPLVFLIYVNMIIHVGIDSFAQRAQASGVDGVIVADLPVEESGPVRTALQSRGVDWIPLVAPTSGERVVQIAAAGSGFLYCVSSLGVTGVRQQLDPALREWVNALQSLTPLPRCVGFGIATAEQAEQVAAFADGVIVGSALVDRLAKVASMGEAAVESEASSFIRTLRDAIDRQQAQCKQEVR
ncbi:MAG: tryptophan synthase subunit alpha [Firmicutes bacterium]|nr:tryptophan synthase subunit alpha [Bacillota bacterium]